MREIYQSNKTKKKTGKPSLLDAIDLAIFGGKKAKPEKVPAGGSPPPVSCRCRCRHRRRRRRRFRRRRS